MRQVGVCILVLLSQSAFAAKPAVDQEQDHWKGEAELGLLATRGNTNTDTLNARLVVDYLTGKWIHQLKLETIKAEDNGNLTADRDSAVFRSKYQLSLRSYLFGSLRYEDDPFAGYDSRTTEVAGYGYKIINRETLKWDIESGLGARQTDRTDNTQTDEFIVRLATTVDWKASENTTLTQELFVEKGDENTLTESTTGLKVKINSALALKLSFKVKDNSQVPVDKKHTDAETAVTLVYDF